MGWVWFLLVVVVVVVGYSWVRRNFTAEIERFRQIRRSRQEK